MCILKLHTTLKIQKNQIILKNQRYLQVASIVATVVELPAGRAGILEAAASGDGEILSR